MPLYVKDREVGELAEKLARMRQTSKTEAVRTALHNEIARVKDPVEEKLVRLREIQARVRAMRGSNPQPITKEWRDSLYEDD